VSSSGASLVEEGAGKGRSSEEELERRLSV
jgi:hypothetical protein